MTEVLTELPVCNVKNYVSINKLKFHPNNPRKIERDRLDDLKQSIIEKGFYEPILVWKKGNTVLAGNHRLKAVQELLEEGYSFKSKPQGTKKVVHTNSLPVVVEDCDDDVAEQILYESNNHYADWIDDQLAKALKDASDRSVNLKGFGFSDIQLENILADAEAEAERAKTLVGEHERAIGDKKDDDDEGEEDKPKKEKKEKTENIALPVNIYNDFMEIVRDIALQLNPDWEVGDSVVPAIEALTKYIYEYGVPDISEL